MQNVQTSAGSDSLWSLRFDLLSAKLLVSIVSLGRDADLRPETHLYFYDCYSRLAKAHSRLGHEARARVLRAKADEHYRASGDDGPPFAAAMGMPRPRAWVMTDARGDRATRASRFPHR
jgi:hypothetical protein